MFRNNNGDVRNWFRNEGGGGRGGWFPLSRSSTLHKGFSNSGSKSRKISESGVSDIKGRRAGVVICW